MNYDVIVIGGEMVGSAAAYHLASSGAHTLLLDRQDVGRATDAGILSAATGTRESDRFDFAVRAFDYYPGLIARLNNEQDSDTGYAVCGKLIVAVTADEEESYRQARSLIFDRQSETGRPGADQFRELSAAEARELFPPLADTLGALYYTEGTRVDGRLLHRALQQAALGHGLTIEEASATEFIQEGNRITGVRVDTGRYTAKNVIVAGGAWSNQFGDQLGIAIPVEPQRGQIIHLGLPGVDTSSWAIVSAFRGHYMVPWDDSRVVVGATREAGSGFESRTTAAGVEEVLDEACRVAPGLEDAEIREIRVGLRPLAQDGRPVLGPVPGWEGLVLATGHGPSGLQLGPYSGKLVGDLAMGIELETDIEPFSIARFPDTS
jgi:D-amino-acid dehydrogenase